jgi:hypothetical protein
VLYSYSQHGGSKMPVKFFCNDCGMEMWQFMSEGYKITLTVAEANKQLKCSNCRLKQVREDLLEEQLREVEDELKA